MHDDDLISIVFCFEQKMIDMVYMQTRLQKLSCASLFNNVLCCEFAIWWWLLKIHLGLLFYLNGCLLQSLATAKYLGVVLRLHPLT